MSKNIEDSLSDKLHTELTKSFIDKRISVLSRGLKQDVKLNVVEVKQPDLDAQLVEDSVTQQLEKRIKFRKEMKIYNEKVSINTYNHIF